MNTYFNEITSKPINTVDGKVVTIKSPVPSPKKLRYAWKDDPQRANLYGTNGLPVAPFEMTITN